MQPLSSDNTADSEDTHSLSEMDATFNADSEDTQSLSEMDATFNDSSQIEDDVVVTEWKGFKIVGDNIDKNINPRHQTIMMNQTKSLHCFQSYAVQDRINLSNYSDIPPTIKPTEDILLSFLPSDVDKTSLISNFNCLSVDSHNY